MSTTAICWRGPFGAPGRWVSVPHDTWHGNTGRDYPRCVYCKRAMPEVV